MVDGVERGLAMHLLCMCIRFGLPSTLATVIRRTRWAGASDDGSCWRVGCVTVVRVVPVCVEGEWVCRSVAAPSTVLGCCWRCQEFRGPGDDRHYRSRLVIAWASVRFCTNRCNRRVWHHTAWLQCVQPAVLRQDHIDVSAAVDRSATALPAVVWMGVGSANWAAGCAPVKV